MRRLLLLLITGMAAVSTAGGARVGRAAGHTDRRPHVSVSDLGGAGPAVVLIPGLSTPRAVWDAFVPDLRLHHHVYSAQVNGFGGEAAGANLQAGVLDGIVADLDGYIRTRKLGRVAIVGHSLGGLTGLMLARAHPEEVDRVLIVDALPYVGDSFRPGVTVAQVEPQARAMRERIASGYGKPRNVAASNEVAATLALSPAARSEIAAWLPAVDLRVAGQAMYEDMTTDLRPEVASIGVPIGLVYPAEGDKLFRSQYGKAAHVTYFPVEGAGHFVMLDQPAAFRTALAAFLK